MSNILVSETIAEFGYDPTNLRPSSEKMVVCTCPSCETIRAKKYRYAAQICVKCANTERSRSSAEQRSMALKTHFKKHGHPRKGVSHTEETKYKISRAKIGKPSPNKGKPGQSGKNNFFYGKKFVFTGKDNGQFGKAPSHTRKCWYVDKTGHRVCFRSTWERNTAQYLDQLNIKWEYESKCLEVVYVVDTEKKVGTYTTDFYLPEFGIYLEVKGRWHSGYKEKFEAASKLIEIELWDREELKRRGII